MASHNAANKLHDANKRIKDPGASGTIVVNKNPAVCHLTSATTETRTLALPTAEGVSVYIDMIVDAGDITLTVASAYNETGDTTFVFSEVGQFLELKSSVTTAGVFYWRSTSHYAIGNQSITEAGVLNGLTSTAAEIDAVADVSARVITLVASGAIAQATHEGKTLLLGEVGGNALCAMTLPAATGSGARYLFRVSVVNTSSYTITTNSTDVFNGTILTHDLDITDGTLLHAFPGTTQTIITLNGSTTGGAIIGDWVEIEDILTGKWFVTGIVSCAAGSNPATPFS